MLSHRPLLFALQGSEDYATAVAQRLGCPLALHEERDYEDGEHKCRPLESVNGREVVVFHSLYGDGRQSANDKLCRLLFFCGALKDAGARQVQVVTPYLCYGRKDRRSQPQDPTITRYVATLIEACGIDRLMALEVHNPAAFNNAFPSILPGTSATPMWWRYPRTPAAPSAPSSFARPSSDNWGARWAVL